LGAVAEVCFIKAAFDPALAVAELAIYSRIHLKTLVAVMSEETAYSSNVAEMPRVFEFFENFASSVAKPFAYSRASR
jgi:hypothetical protein